MTTAHRVVWAAAGAIIAPAAVFAILIVFLGGAGMCELPTDGCDLAIGLMMLASAPVGAILLWAIGGITSRQTGRGSAARTFGRNGRDQGSSSAPEA